jgi:4a-hydroxytetrahydrobiopterin dehydratase
MALARESCGACTGATPKVRGDELESLRAEISPEWEVHGGRLFRHVPFKDFTAAFSAATAVARIADAEGHHPDICIGWGRLDIEVTTHAVKGLTRNDFILAAKIDVALAGA